MSGARFLVTFLFLVAIAFAYSRIYVSNRYTDKNVKQDVVEAQADQVIKSVGYRHSPGAFAGVTQEKYFDTAKGKAEKDARERFLNWADPTSDFRSKVFDFNQADEPKPLTPEFQTPDQWQSFPRTLEERAAIQRNLGARQETLPGSRFSEEQVTGLENDVRRKIYDINDPNKIFNLDNQRILDNDPEGSRAVKFQNDSYYNKDLAVPNHERNNADEWDPNVKRYLKGKHLPQAKVEELFNNVPELPVPAAVNASTVYDKGASRQADGTCGTFMYDDDKTKRELRMQGASGWYSKATPSRATNPGGEGPTQWRELLGETFRVNDISSGSKKEGPSSQEVRPRAKNAYTGKFHSDVLNETLGSMGRVPPKSVSVTTKARDQKDASHCTEPHLEGSMEYNDDRVLKRYIPDPEIAEHHYPTNESQVQNINVS